MNRKIGFSNTGGVYIGENIQTKTHLHQAITIIISFEDQFDFSCERETGSCSGVIIQPNTIRQFKSKKNSSTAFIHIEPFSEQGLKLTDRTRPFKTLSQIQIKNIIKFLKIWLSHNKSHEKSTEKLINSVTPEISTNTITIDQRIEKAIDLIRKVESPTLKSIAATLNLSAFRLSHLFKQETGITFKKFVLYTKLVKSLKAIYENQSLTQSSYSGNFSDQAHFTRTYNNAFGILPSKTLK